MDGSLVTLAKQFTIERRFNCVVCLCARFQMVYGRCQHRICTGCAYGTDGILRQQCRRCPSCQQEGSFPERKPTIPEDNIELQKLIGVTACENEGCEQEFWSWEKAEHELTCAFKNSRQRDAQKLHQSTNTPKTTRSRNSRYTRDTPKREYVLRSRQNSTTDNKLDNPGYHFRRRSARGLH